MASPVSGGQRAAVIDRAQGRCEYCLKPQVGFFAHEVDHVVALKHGGLTTLENLAFACLACNRYKGTDLASFDPESGALTALFHPRRDRWDESFRLDEEGILVPLTAAARTTVFLLRLNDRERVAERKALGLRR